MSITLSSPVPTPCTTMANVWLPAAGKFGVAFHTMRIRVPPPSAAQSPVRDPPPPGLRSRHIPATRRAPLLKLTFDGKASVIPLPKLTLPLVLTKKLVKVAPRMFPVQPPPQIRLIVPSSVFVKNGRRFVAAAAVESAAAVNG